MRVTLLKRRINSAGRYRVRFASVGTAVDFGGKRPPWLWTFDGGDAGLLEVVSGTRAAEGSVCAELFRLVTGASEVGMAADTDSAVDQAFDAELAFADDGRREVRLRHVESGREAVIVTGVE